MGVSQSEDGWCLCLLTTRTLPQVATTRGEHLAATAAAERWRSECDSHRDWRAVAQRMEQESALRAGGNPLSSSTQMGSPKSESCSRLVMFASAAISALTYVGREFTERTPT